MSTLISSESEKELKKRLVELELEISGYKQNEMVYEDYIKKLKKVIDSEPIITEEQYLRSINAFQNIIGHLRRNMIRSSRNRLECSFCGSVKKRMTMFYSPDTGEILNLCFRGCQHFPEPFRDTEAGIKGEWIRIDPWQEYKREQPRLRKNFKPVGKLTRQSKLELEK